MKWWYAVSLPGLMPMLATLGARPALAADGRCSPIAMEADASVRSRWPDVSERLREAFDARDDIDGCARVRLSMHDAAFDVEVILPDGRSAGRTVARAQDVVPTLEALLLLPEPTAPLAHAVDPVAAPTPAAADVPTDSHPSRPVVSHRAAPTQSTKPRPSADRPSGLRVEFSVAAGARIGDGQASLGLGVLSFLDIAAWLVGFEGRADSYQSITDGSSAAGALELAVLAGRRFGFGTHALDLTVGTAFVASPGSTATSSVAAGAAGVTGPTLQEPRSSRLVPRLLLGVRLNFGARSVLRSFVGIEGGLGRGAADLPIGEPRLPGWTVGLGLGATVGTL